MLQFSDSLAKLILGLGLAFVTLAPYDESRAQSLNVLYAFKGGTDGAYPLDGLLMDDAGNLYGTTYSGGDSNCDSGTSCGTVFMVAPGGKETVLHAFKGGNDGAWPYAGLVADTAGNLYGTTAGGAKYGFGTVFKVVPGGTETVIHAFSDIDTKKKDGAEPYAGVLFDEAGTLYGTTRGGGAYGQGTVFKLASDGTESLLHSFTGGRDGDEPLSGLTFDAAGNLYGTTYLGGSQGYGNVFELATSKHETVIYSFNDEFNGGQPAAGLIMDGSGNLYGTTSVGGQHECGTIFKIPPGGKLATIYAFKGGSRKDGCYPAAGVIADAAGNLYGTTYQGGVGGYGTVFKLAPDGTETVLYPFKAGSDGTYPQAGLIMDAAGNLYGTTYSGGDDSCGSGDGCGTVFEIVP